MKNVYILNEENITFQRSRITSKKKKIKTEIRLNCTVKETEKKFVFYVTEKWRKSEESRIENFINIISRARVPLMEDNLIKSYIYTDTSIKGNVGFRNKNLWNCYLSHTILSLVVDEGGDDADFILYRLCKNTFRQFHKQPTECNENFIFISHKNRGY